MAEALSPFLDTTFSDPGAARLAASLRRKKSGISTGGNNSGALDFKDEDAELQAALQASMAAGGASGSGFGSGGAGTSKVGGGALDNVTAMEIGDEDRKEEDEDWVDLVAEEAPKEEEYEEEEMVPKGPSPEEVAAAAEERLPAEPAGPEGCRIGENQINPSI